MPSKNDQPYKGKANLNVLFGDDETDGSSEKLLNIDSIKLPASQPRRYFDDRAMQSLVESIKADGILQPLLVRPLNDGKYELIAGERRYRAAREIGLKEVPVTIRELTEQQALHIALVENLQREDLNPVEETEGILELLSHHLEYSTDDVSKLLYRMQNDVQRTNDNVILQPEAETVIEVFERLGKMGWESFVSNRLSLLKLPKDILEKLREGKIEYTKARAIAKVKDESARKELLETAIAENLSLTQIKERIAALKTGTLSEKPEEGLKNQIKEALTKANKSKVWSDPKKQKRLQKILTDLEALLTT
ncbi:ParB/RepB/Spo0J family partition protein [Planktothrix sp. FACHB-1355]|uniref:ParB/RepB/Spo0J family partition protein n=1 Tax=Aerosakkonema funiforme FACHB-1375 TaxID=2949571 RepID=A0A926ZKT5_9CYAN|nr:MULTISPECIES: ParB/RepB/Spo0J family partition protein [Oscillatoriales]MBD2185677.1 ParB/RepB/Spo0J family partition protein [Aerosakkonema funiforme FACHB-1375]MBD3561889.1 ParB/RepB/Spo0J family partition protein [Planktothrix sp. FACHB-1355]